MTPAGLDGAELGSPGWECAWGTEARARGLGCRLTLEFRSRAEAGAWAGGVSGGTLAAGPAYVGQVKECPGGGGVLPTQDR